MNVIGFFYTMRMLVALICLPLVGLAFAGMYTYQELSLRAHFRNKCGEQWQTEYERLHGSLATANTKILVCALAAVAICVISWILYRQFVPKHRGLLRRRKY